MVTSPSRRTSTVLLSISAAMLIGAGVGTWAWTRSDDKSSTCSALLEDNRVKDALGSAYADDLTCAELGAKLKGVAMGNTQGAHSMKQAQAMRDILTATDDALRKNSNSVDQALRVPLGDLLANYASDTHEILERLNSDYVVHLADDEPWQDKDGVHMSVAYESLARVVRAVSDTPSAYIKIRVAAGRYAAESLVVISKNATGSLLSVPACGNAMALGPLDAVAADIVSKLPEKEADKWNKAVLDGVVTPFASAVPSYKSDPVGHVTGTWAKQTEESQEELAATLNSQAVDYLRIWGESRAEGSALPKNLVKECEADGDRSRSEAAAFLKSA